MQRVSKFVFLWALLSSCLVRTFVSTVSASEDAKFCDRYREVSIGAILEGSDPFALRCALAGKLGDRALTADQALAAETLLNLFEVNNGAGIVGALRYLEGRAESSDTLCNKISRELRRAYLLEGNYAAYVRLRAASCSEMAQAVQGIRSGPKQSTKASRIGVQARLKLKTLPTGHRFVEATAADTAIEMIIDTGSEVSLVPRSLAQELGFQRLGAEQGVAVSLSGNFSGYFALSPVLQLGEMTVEHLIFFVIDDDPKTRKFFGDRPVLGLNALIAAGGATFLGREDALILGRPAKSQRCWRNRDEMFIMNGRPYLTAHFETGPALAFFDTGINYNAGFAPPVGFYADELRVISHSGFYAPNDNALIQGGTFTGVRRARFSLAEQELTIRDLPIFRLKAGGKLGATLWLGAPLVERLDVLMLDFESMTFSVEKKQSEISAACLQFAAD